MKVTTVLYRKDTKVHSIVYAPTDAAKVDPTNPPIVTSVYIMKSALRGHAPSTLELTMEFNEQTYPTQEVKAV